MSVEEGTRRVALQESAHAVAHLSGNQRVEVKVLFGIPSVEEYGLPAGPPHAKAISWVKLTQGVEERDEIIVEHMHDVVWLKSAHEKRGRAGPVCDREVANGLRGQVDEMLAGS